VHIYLKHTATWLTVTFTNCPAYSTSARTAQKTPFLCCCLFRGCCLPTGLHATIYKLRKRQYWIEICQHNPFPFAHYTPSSLLIINTVISSNFNGHTHKQHKPSQNNTTLKYSWLLSAPFWLIQWWNTWPIIFCLWNFNQPIVAMCLELSISDCIQYTRFTFI
jgi:hypothetical protein